MNRKLKTTLLIGLVAGVTISAFTQEIAAVKRYRGKVLDDVRLYGNRHLSRSVILDILQLEKGKPIPEDWHKSGIQQLYETYSERGLLFFEVDSVRAVLLHDTSRVALGLWLDEGKPVRIGTVALTVLPPIDKENMTLKDSRPGRIFNAGSVENDIENLLAALENNGYPLAEACIDSIHINQQNSDPKLQLYLRIRPGNLVTVGTVDVSGLKITKKAVIMRESRLKPGTIFDYSKVLAAQDNIRRLGFLDVHTPSILFVDSMGVITFNVTDLNANTLDGVIGYTPSRNETDPGYVTGRLQFTFRNLFGTSRFLEAYWEKKDRYSQAMRFGYEEPWLLGWPLHLGGTFEQLIRDTTYIDRQWNVRLRLTPWSTLSIDISGGQQEILPDSAGSAVYNIPRSSAWIFKAGIDYNTLNDYYNPSRGLRYRTQITLGKKSNLGPDFLLDKGEYQPEVNTRKIMADAEAIVSIFRQHALYLGLHGAEVKTGDRQVPVSEQILFGGSKTVRGYREDLFHGTLAAWLNAEYRLLIGPRSRAFVFVDWGLFQRKEDERLIRGSQLGYGFGVRIETRLGIMGIDYGLGEGDGLLQGKVHVSLMNAF